MWQTMSLSPQALFPSPLLFYLDSAIHFHLWQQKPQDKIVTKRIIFQINDEIDLKLYYLSACSKVH